MQGPHDMGGRHGMGDIPDEFKGQGTFRFPFEGRMHGITLNVLANGCFNLDEFRHGSERMPWAQYLDSSYYEKWLFAVENLLVEKGLLTHEEVDARVASQPPVQFESHPRRPAEMTDFAASMQTLILGGTPHNLPEEAPAQFEVGQSIMVRNLHEEGHNRLPAYLNGKPGVVHIHHGAHRDPGPSANEQVEKGAHLYTVQFDGKDVWGPDHEPTDVIYADLFESYIEAA